jgi:hypothetical protein
MGTQELQFAMEPDTFIPQNTPDANQFEPFVHFDLDGIPSEQLTNEWITGNHWITNELTTQWQTQYDESLETSSLRGFQPFSIWSNQTTMAMANLIDSFAPLSNMEQSPILSLESQHSSLPEQPPRGIPFLSDLSPSAGGDQVVFSSPELAVQPQNVSSPDAEYSCRFCADSFAKKHLLK